MPGAKRKAESAPLMESTMGPVQRTTMHPRIGTLPCKTGRTSSNPASDYLYVHAPPAG